MVAPAMTAGKSPANVPPPHVAVRVLEAHAALARELAAPALAELVLRTRDGRLPVVIHSQVPWDSVWQRPQELARGLAERRDVLFFAPVQAHDLATRYHDRWSALRREGGLAIYSPVEFSGEYRTAMARALNRRLRLRLLAPALARTPHIYLTNQVFDDSIPRRFRSRRTVVDLIDDFAAFEWAPPGARRAEARLIARADLVTAGTGALQRRWRAQLPGIEFLPSGVNLAAFSGPQPAEPADLRALPRPRVLYVGSLNDRMDGPLFLAAARAVPEGSVVVVGPRTAAFQLGGAQPRNLHFLGLKPHGELAGYYRNCDIGIMPFADTPAAKAINPVKSLEFLAAGLPVLSTPIPDVVEFYPGVIETAAPAHWPASIARLLASAGDAQARARRLAFAEGRGWDRLVAAFEERLAKLD
jgi:glycosyltransferase involved in cell wall biosynthesis